jgi:hypothetical protein
MRSMKSTIETLGEAVSPANEESNWQALRLKRRCCPISGMNPSALAWRAWQLLLAF